MSKTKYRKIPTAEYFKIIKTQLENSGKASVRANSSSMKPFLKPERDTVELDSFNGGIKRGDLVLFEICPNRYALHRVISIGTETFSMQGDNVACAENNLLYGKILGIASAVIRSGKKISRGSAEWQFFAMLGIINRGIKRLWFRFIRPVLSCVYHKINNIRRIEKRNGKDQDKKRVRDATYT